jgi:hypothetical protein
MDALSTVSLATLAQAYNDRNADATQWATAALCADLPHDRPWAMWHPLGFFRINLGRDAAGLSYIIHCWPRDFRATQQPAWLVHRHAWDLESFVLEGSLEDVQYDQVVGDATENGTLYLASGTPDHTSRLDRTDVDLHLRRRTGSRMPAGRFYRVDIGQFHQSYVPVQGHCLTLARTGPRLRRNSQVLGDHDGPDLLTYTHDAVDHELVDTVLRSFTFR